MKETILLIAFYILTLMAWDTLNINDIEAQSWLQYAAQHETESDAWSDAWCERHWVEWAKDGRRP